jgi:hypothetical protein
MPHIKLRRRSVSSHIPPGKRRERLWGSVSGKELPR